MSNFGLTRNPDVIKKSYKKMPDGSVIALEDLTIQFPERYFHINLAEFGAVNEVLGVFIIYNERGEYGLMSVCGMVPLMIYESKKVTLDGVDYIELKYPKGSIMITNTAIVRNDKLSYRTYLEFLSRVNVPWFMTEEDLANVQSTAYRYSDSKAGRDRILIELQVSAMARVKGDLTKQYRHHIKNKTDLINDPPEYVSFRDKGYAATNTFARLSGSRVDDGFTSALIHPTEEVENIEKLLRT